MVDMARGQRSGNARRGRPKVSRLALARRCARFGKDESGALAIWSVFMFLMILMVAGIGADFMLNEMKRTRLQATLDRAVLAAADLDQTLEPSGVVASYFDKAGMSDFLASVDVDEGVNYRSVTADATSKTQTLFIDMLGVDYLYAPALGTAEEDVPNIEISLILDISGSMRYNNRMDNLKPAAQEFVSTVLRGDAANTTSINVVPYAGQTNPGPAMFEFLNGRRYDETHEDHFPTWSEDISDVTLYYDRNSDGEIGRVVRISGFPSSGSEGHISNDLDDFMPRLHSFIADKYSDVGMDDEILGVQINGAEADDDFFRYAGNANGAAPDGFPPDWTEGELHKEYSYSYFWDNRFPNVSSCLELESADFAHSGLPQTGLDQVSHFMYWTIAADVMDWGWCPEDDTRIQYAQNNEFALRDFIENIRMHDGTGTHYAMKWGLALLDPAARPAFSYLSSYGQVPSDFSSRPSEWEEENWRKVIVLMTDGQITDQYRPKEKMHPDNMDVELQHQSNSRRERFTSRSTNLSRFYALCDFAKDNGVTVYTISFEAPSGAKTEMRNCASSPSHYFDVNGVEISDAFAAIAGQINELRLTQ